MNNGVWRQWPALQDMPATLPAELEYQRGVFGKVHKARSDFRWIARSQGFHRGEELEETLYLGSQDKPCPLAFWRCLKTDYFAGVAYPSRAQDAAQRGGFLEKQIADLGRSGLPAALSALLSLRVVWQWNDSIWWDRQEGGNWSQSDSVLPIAAADCPGLDLEGLEDRLGKAIAEGLAGLMELGKESLAYFYASLLAGETPAILPSTKPLGPEALAALLLPLPRPLADRLSLLGWVPSNLYELKDLGKCWDGAVLSVDQNAPELSAKAKEFQAEAEKLTRALLENRPEDLAPAKPCYQASIAEPGVQNSKPPLDGEESIQAEKTAVSEAILAPRNGAALETTALGEQELEGATKGGPIPSHTKNSFPESTSHSRQCIWSGRYDAVCELDMGVGDTDSLTHLLLEFSRRARRRVLNRDVLSNGLEKNYKLGSEPAKRLAMQIREWISQMENPPELADSAQWAFKLAQLRVVARMLDTPSTPDFTDPEEQRIHRAFAGRDCRRSNNAGWQ
ncbi:MAG: hypothetical protein DM484_02655 [Candidatus Methylumidiphilus alinenensis]|uniref:Uncharacterized protein n=1 Tax=Candidatus Methylumidiphilus alinenensis TaxID=2202197 RepID=A0A2W4TJL1_9GAMM|nr:MAG: hypothetical protein DM484_02655 [Candidatus Methylumidiphilus alinenensis]